MKTSILKNVLIAVTKLTTFLNQKTTDTKRPYVRQNPNHPLCINFTESSNPEDQIFYFFGVPGLSILNFLRSVGITETSANFWHVFNYHLTSNTNNSYIKKETTHAF